MAAKGNWSLWLLLVRDLKLQTRYADLPCSCILIGSERVWFFSGGAWSKDGRSRSSREGAKSFCGTGPLLPSSSALCPFPIQISHDRSGNR